MTSQFAQSSAHTPQHDLETSSAASQVLLQRKSGLKLNPITTLYYVAPCCFLFLLLPWAVLEAKPLVAGVAAGTIRVDSWVMVTNACIAFALNLAVFLLIGSTSGESGPVLGDWRLFHCRCTGLLMWPVACLAAVRKFIW